MLSAIVSSVLHASILLLIHTEIRFDVLALLAGGDLKTFHQIVSNADFKILFQSFILYCGTITFLAVVAGVLFRCLVDSTRLHKRDFKQNLMNDKGNILTNEPGDPKEIDGDIMIIPFSSVINMNLHFVAFPEDIDAVPADANVTIPEEEAGIAPEISLS